MTDHSAAAEAHCSLFNESVRTGAWKPFVATFTDDARMAFTNVPVGPYVGRDAIAAAYAENPPDDTMTIESWSSVYAGANWHERETWEMYGIAFAGHPDLRNMYLPTNFEGHPLRKDFPLLARIVKPWPGIVDVEDLPPPEEARQDAAIQMMRQTNLGLLIIDDVQNVLAGTRLQQRRLLNLRVRELSLVVADTIPSMAACWVIFQADPSPLRPPRCVILSCGFVRSLLLMQRTS